MDISHSVLLLVDSLWFRCKVAVYCENRHRREDKERHDQLCNISHQQITSKLDVESSQLEVAYKLVQFEGKGRGLVATRTLEFGELVLSERAFLKISFKSKITSFPRLIEFEPEIRAKLMNLSCPADSSLKDFFPSPLKITKHLVIFCQKNQNSNKDLTIYDWSATS